MGCCGSGSAAIWKENYWKFKAYNGRCSGWNFIRGGGFFYRYTKKISRKYHTLYLLWNVNGRNMRLFAEVVA